MVVLWAHGSVLYFSPQSRSYLWAVPASWAARCIPDVWQLFRPFFVAAAGRTPAWASVLRMLYQSPTSTKRCSAVLAPAYTCVAVFLLPAPTGFLGLRRRLHRVLEFLGCIIEYSAFSFHLRCLFFPSFPFANL